MRLFAAVSLAVLAACSSSPSGPGPSAKQETFSFNVTGLVGQPGRVTED